MSVMGIPANGEHISHRAQKRTHREVCLLSERQINFGVQALLSLSASKVSSCVCSGSLLLSKETQLCKGVMCT